MRWQVHANLTRVLGLKPWGEGATRRIPLGAVFTIEKWDEGSMRYGFSLVYFWWDRTVLTLGSP
jgi:hypothetical protein